MNDFQIEVSIWRFLDFEIAFFRDYNSILTFECVRNSSWDGFSVLRGVILGTCNLLSEVLDDRFVHPVIHRDTSWDTLGVQTWILSILGVFWDLLGSYFRDSLDENVDVKIDVGIRKLFSKRF